MLTVDLATAADATTILGLRHAGRHEFADGSSWFGVALFERSIDR